MGFLKDVRTNAQGLDTLIKSQNTTVVVMVTVFAFAASFYLLPVRGACRSIPLLHLLAAAEHIGKAEDDGREHHESNHESKRKSRRHTRLR